MQYHLLSPAEKKYKQAFKKHVDRFYRTYQSKQIHIGEASYVVVGQTRLQPYPLISHFDVVDTAGQSADTDTAQKVHYFISQLFVTGGVVRQLKEPLAQLATTYASVESIAPRFTVEHEQDANKLMDTTDLNLALDAMEQLIEQADVISQKEAWDEEDLEGLDQVWANFWTVYDQRARALLRLYENNLSRKPNAEDEAWVPLLWQESTMLYKHYQTLTPVGAKIGTYTMDALIAHNAQFGRLKQSDAQENKIYKLERVLDAIITYMFRLTVWILIPLIVIALWSERDVLFETLTPFLFFVIIFIIVKKQNKRRLLAKFHQYWAEQRAVPAQESSAGVNTDTSNQSGSLSADKQSETKHTEKMQPKQTQTLQVLYETQAIIMYYIYIPLIFAAITFAIPLYMYLEGETDYSFVWVPVLIGVIFLIIAFIISRTISRKRVIIMDHMIQIHKEKIDFQHIKRIVMKANGKDIQIYVTYHDAPYKIRLTNNDWSPLKSVLKKFCKSKGIKFESYIANARR